MAYEPVLRAFLRFRISYNPSELDAILFLMELRNRYCRTSVWTDEGVWYSEVCRYLRLEHHVFLVEWKNLIERMIQALKDRLENFDDLFPCLRGDCDRAHISNWVSVFTFFHNLVSTEDGQPEYQRFIQSLSEVLT